MRLLQVRSWQAPPCWKGRRKSWLRPPLSTPVTLCVPGPPRDRHSTLAPLSAPGLPGQTGRVCRRPVGHMACAASLRGGHRPEGSWPAGLCVRLPPGSASQLGAPDGLPSEPFGIF